MKKISLLVMPLVAMSFLASCSCNNNGLGKPMPLEQCTWAKISQVSKAGKASEWFKVGDTKKVTVNGVDHQVRIIGFNQDVNKNNRKIGITFEFANLLSDSDGYSLASLWNDVPEEQIGKSNHNYYDSTIYHNLTDTTIGTAKWYEKGGETKSTNYKDSVWLMLPKKLRDVIVPTNKVTYVYKEESGWEQVSHIDSLFLPTPKEMGYYKDYYTETNVPIYEYYKECDTKVDCEKRIKQQIKGGEGAIPQHTNITDPLFGPGTSYAGYDNGGGYSYLRSPAAFFEASEASRAWSITNGGTLTYGQDSFKNADAVAPAFCI